MKNLTGMALAFLLGSIGAAWAFIPLANSSTWNAMEAQVFPLAAPNVFTPNLIILGQQLSTGQAFPSIRTLDQWPEPADGGRAFEFVVQGIDGGIGWVNEANSIFTIQNGIVDDPPITNVDIYGNYGPPPNTPINNRYLWASYKDFTPADGDFAWGSTTSVGWFEFSDVIWNYSVDGTDGADTTFQMSVTDGVGTWTIDLPCVQGTTVPQHEEVLSGSTRTINFTQITVSFVNTGNCAVVPTIRELQIFNVYTIGT